VRSPVFRGKVSTHLKIEGVLGEPIALGDVTINSGVMQFPFANIPITQGLVALSSDNPYQPQLFVTGGSRVFGYEIKVEVHGPALKPIVEFSSTPSLTSEQIVMMLTTGKLPSEGAEFSSGKRATKLGLFLGKSFLSKFGGGEGSAERLTIRSGDHISEQGKESYSAEYKLNDDWSMIGEYGRFNDFNFGFKWKIYSK
jgi:translocation and assembly module TamB